MSNWIILLLRQLLTVVSGPLRETITNFATDFRKKAKETPNPWDDVLADILCWILDID